MSFFEVICGNIISYGINVILLMGVIAALLEKTPRKKKEQRIKIFFIVLLYLIVISVIFAAFFKAGLFNAKKYNIFIVLTEYISLAGIAFLMKILYEETLKNAWICAVFFSILRNFSEEFIDLFLPDHLYRLDVLNERFFYFFILYVLYPLSLSFFAFAFRKIGLGKSFQKWIDGKDAPFKSIVLISSYPILKDALQFLFERGERMYGVSIAVSLVMFPVILMMFLYMSREEMRKKQLEAQQISLQQQRSYIESLEKIQKDMRQFRHDYKNMMSSMYIQAKEGNLEAIQNFIQDMTIEFDNQVGRQIYRQTQLGNVHMLEVKGLLLGKLAEMEMEQIVCELEVRSPFYQTCMRSVDLCRCLGILIDNAIEEARGKEQPRIQILISAQGNYTTIRVKNALYSKVDFHKIWQQGYSTKGPDRGIGLASYKKIVERYDNILPVTTISDGFFIQELKIQEFRN